MSDSDFSDDGDIDLILCPLTDDAFADFSSDSEDEDFVPSPYQRKISGQQEIVARKLSGQNENIIRKKSGLGCENAPREQKKLSVSFMTSLQQESQNYSAIEEEDSEKVFTDSHHPVTKPSLYNQRQVNYTAIRKPSIQARRVSVVVQPERNRRTSIARRPSIALSTPRLRWVQVHITNSFCNNVNDLGVFYARFVMSFTALCM